MTRYFNVDQFPTAKTASKDGSFVPKSGVSFITTKDVSTILDYSLALSVMRNATESEINDVFDRINTYGHRLSDQERRQSGVQNEFSAMVRRLACLLRGDTSAEILPLQSMPSISIDLPMESHGYEVRADEVFWVIQGILRSTDLRDSLDEQCIADIASCIIGGQIIERSKDALDEIYSKNSTESERIITALEVYGEDKLKDEIKFCIDELLKVCETGEATKLRDLIFAKKTTNAFPSVFAVILLSFHELIIGAGKKISDYASVKKALHNLSERIDTSRKATAVEERRKNIDVVKGLIKSSFVKATSSQEIYTNHTTIDIDSLIRRSEIELPNFELKQGCLFLSPLGGLDLNVIEKILKTICAIANNGPKSSGKILIGVTDKKSDADTIKKLDLIEPKKVGKRWVVGINREAKRLGETTEQYFSRWKNAIKNSKLSDKLLDSVLSHIDYNAFYGLGVIVITLPSQSELSYLDGQVYSRKGDSTEHAASPMQIASAASRFSKS
jgi:Putative DNA-binding domain